MAKRRSASKDVYANRYRGRLSFGADASTAVYESFNTGISMTGMQPHKWDILWFSMQPAHADDAPVVCEDGTLEFQLAFGTHTALLEPDDMQCVASGAFINDNVPNGGGGAYSFPIYAGIRAPLVCLSSVLTVLMVATNQTPFNSKEWMYEIGYLTRPTSANEAAEFFAQVGAL
jgi:hypothetical protein